MKEKEKMKKASKIASIVLLSLLCVSMGAAVYAAVGVSVYIRNALKAWCRATVGWEKSR